MKQLKVTLAMGIMLFLIAGCQNEEANPLSSSVDQELSKSDKAKPKTMVWSDGILFESVVTPAEFDGNKGNYDRLYVGSFYNEVALISESKPGDQDYNGGRWDMYVVKEDVTTDYSMAKSDQDLNPDDFESAGNYFECPLLPRKGN